MKTVEMNVDGNIQELGLPSSKKSIIIASTEGNVSVPNREKEVGLNVYRTK